MSPSTLFTDPVKLPLLPLRDVVVFPHMVIPLFVGRPKSIRALELAMEAGKHIMLVAQKSAAKDEPSFDDLYRVGAIASILQMLKLPDGTVKVLVEGTQRVRVQEFIDADTHFLAQGEPMAEVGLDDSEIEAMRRALLAQFDNYVKLNKKIPPEILASLAGIDDAGRLTDTIAAHLPLKLDQKQAILEMTELKARLDHLMGFLETEIDILQVEKRIRGRVKRQMEKSQREYYLNEQVKAIQKELGDVDESGDLDELDKRIRAARMSKEAMKKAESELKKLKMMSPMSAEATVVRTYIETLVNLPWVKKTKISKDLARAQQILDEDHYGLEKGQGTHRRIPRCAGARGQAQGAHPLSGRPARGGQDLVGPIHRPCHQPQVRAHGLGGRARRSRNSRPSTHLHRFHAGQDPAKPDQGHGAQPLLPAR